MQRIRHGLVIPLMLLCLASSATASVSIGINFPNVRIGVNLPVFPRLDVVPGYPVYYAPEVAANYFFYDGLYWVYQDDNWYASSWYNGPWDFVDPEMVPLYVLRIPVAYYRHRPASFRGWHADAPPRWGQRWGRDWEKRRKGWDHWKRTSIPVRAPRPEYQRHYSREHYPRREQQQSLHSKHYRYQSRDTIVRARYQPKGDDSYSGHGRQGRADEYQEDRMQGREDQQERKHEGNRGRRHRD